MALSRIVAKTGGSLQIYSGRCLIQKCGDNEPTTLKVAELMGTIVELRVARGRVYDFSKMLADIWQDRFGAIGRAPMRFVKDQR